MILFDKMQKKKHNQKKDTYETVPERYRTTYGKMEEAIQKGDFQEALCLAQELKDQGADRELWAMQMSTAYLGLGKTAGARASIEPLYREYPDDLEVSVQRALCLHVEGSFQEAEKTLERVYPPQRYIPFYYSVYGDALENQGKLERAYEKYRVVIDEFQKGYDPGRILIEGIFQRLIELGMAGGRDTVDQDMEEYIRFLETTENDEIMQKRIADNLILFAGYLGTEKYRLPFRKLTERLDEMGFMVNPVYRRTLWSAYVSLESYAINEDSQISRFTFDLITWAANVGTEEDRRIDAGEELTEAEKELLLMEYFACRRMPDILRELERIREKYPYSYETVEELTEELKKDGSRASDKYLKRLLKQTEFVGYTKSYFDRIYEENYGSASGSVLWASEEGSYVRTEKKVGRNDPCPCGSGKKYKHCCGRK